MSTITSFSETFGAPTSNACDSLTALVWLLLMLSRDDFSASAKLPALAAPDSGTTLPLATRPAPPRACVDMACICWSAELNALIGAFMGSPEGTERNCNRRQHRDRCASGTI